MRFTIHDSPATSPSRSTVRAGVVRVFNGYAVPNVATVEAWPHRPMSHARQIARRIVRDAESYLTIINTYTVPGITDTRTAGARAA